MAENEDGQEKTEQPSAKRLQDARRKGQVPRSRELNAMAVTMVGVISLVSLSRPLAESLKGVMADRFRLSREDIFDSNSLLLHMVDGFQEALFSLLPLFGLLVAAAILSSVALGGFNLSAEAMKPKLSKLSPLKGLKRIFSAKGLLELVKSMAKFVLIGGTTLLLLWFTMDDYLRLHEMDLQQAMDELSWMISWSVILLTSTLIVVAAIDVPFQLWDHKRQLKMTRQEQREEMKETEGKPEVKGRIRQLQREMAQRRMMQEVPKADVIVTNPTHYAVALQYDSDSMLAPKLVAKGGDLLALAIRQTGEEAAVPVVESPILARAIYFHTELDEFIPAGLYLAVAQLLAYVFQLKAYSEIGGDCPVLPDEFPVPDELRHG